MAEAAPVSCMPTAFVYIAWKKAWNRKERISREEIVVDILQIAWVASSPIYWAEAAPVSRTTLRPASSLMLQMCFSMHSFVADKRNISVPSSPPLTLSLSLLKSSHAHALAYFMPTAQRM